MTYLATSFRSSVPNATREIRALRKAPRALYSRQRGNSRSANRRSYSAACPARMWITMTSRSLMTLLPSSDRTFQSQVATRDGTQNTLAWIDARLYGLHLTATRIPARPEARSSIAQLLIPVGSAARWGEVVQVPERLDGADVAGILPGLGWCAEK